MGEAKKIVTEHYPVDKLPEELRRGLDQGVVVRVTVEANVDKPVKHSIRSILGSGQGLYASPQDAVDYIRKLRDESDR